MGWSEEAPIDAIIVTAGAPEIPEKLKAQLADGGRLVIPAGPRHMQTLYTVKRSRDDFFTTQHTDCVFVPMIGACGWNELT